MLENRASEEPSQERSSPQEASLSVQTGAFQSAVWRHRLKALLWGVAFGAAGLFSAALVVRESIGQGWTILAYAAGLAAFMLGMLIRRVVAVLIARLSGWCGAAMGALVVLLSHPLAWNLVALHHTFFAGPSSLGDTPLGAADVPWAGFILAFWSLALTGWWTVPFGSGLGVLLVRVERGMFSS